MPVLCRLGDGEKGPAVEQSLYNEMRRLNLTLVGWLVIVVVSLLILLMLLKKGVYIEKCKM